MTTEFFSVVIPTCHRNDLLARCLDRLAPGAQTLPAARYEVIVSDDGSVTTAEVLLRETLSLGTLGTGSPPRPCLKPQLWRAFGPRRVACLYGR